MNDHSLRRITKEVCALAKNVAAFIIGEVGTLQRGAIEAKSLNSLVSYVDREAEKQLVTRLREICPEASFLTEEETVGQEQKDLRWIVDPLDGTTNFLHQLPFYSISIALEEKGEIILGVVYECNRKECFSAMYNLGATLNGEPIKVSSNERIADCLLATGFPYYNFDELEGYLKILAHFMRNTRGLRRLGSAALDLAYVACGRFDGFFETNLNPWDVAAGVILVKEAGGKITDYQGADRAQLGKEILGTNGKVYDEMFAVINGKFS